MIYRMRPWNLELIVSLLIRYTPLPLHKRIEQNNIKVEHNWLAKSHWQNHKQWRSTLEKIRRPWKVANRLSGSGLLKGLKKKGSRTLLVLNTGSVHVLGINLKKRTITGLACPSRFLFPATVSPLTASSLSFARTTAGKNAFFPANFRAKERLFAVAQEG